MIQPAEDISSLGYSTIEKSTTGPSSSVAPASSSQKSPMLEGYTNSEYMNLYNSMVSVNSKDIHSATQKKYGMTDNVDEYPPTHPEYSPSPRETALNDSQEILNHQYTNMTTTLVTTAALGLIAIMITSGAM